MVVRLTDAELTNRSFDVSKQIVGQLFVHGVNVLISDLVAHHASGNPCVLYFLNILIDTTLGSYASITFFQVGLISVSS